MGPDGDALGLTYAFASSVSDAAFEASQKALVLTMPRPELALVMRAGVISAIFGGTFLATEDDAVRRLRSIFSSPEFLKAWAVSGSSNVAATNLMIVGLQRGKVTDTVPYLSLSPAFLLASGYVVLGELPDIRGMLSVGIISVGGCWLSRVSASDSLQLERRSNLLRLPPGAGIYLFVAFIQSVSSAFDKRGVRAASPLVWGATISATVAMCSLVRALWTGSARVGSTCDRIKPATSLKGLFSNWSLMSLACALKLASYWFQLKANERLYSAHISAIRKSGVLLVLLFGRVFFREQIGRKLLPVSTMVFGVCCLALR